MLKKNEIVISIKVYNCKAKKAEILKICGINIDMLGDYETIEIYLLDAQKIGLIERW
jgi:hypothetical protein